MTFYGLKLGAVAIDIVYIISNDTLYNFGKGGFNATENK